MPHKDKTTAVEVDDIAGPTLARPGVHAARAVPPRSGLMHVMSRVRTMRVVQRGVALGGQSSSGLLAATVSSLCCLPIALAFALGLGGSAALVGLTRYRPIFVIAGLGVALVATAWSLHRSARCCSASERRRNRLLIPALTLGTFGASYVVINYVLLPWLYTLG